MKCAFCELPVIKERVICSGPLVWAFPTNIPITEGHTLVVPRRCVRSLSELTNAEILAIMRLAKRVQKALKKAFGAEAFNVCWNEGRIAGQTVPHFHLHIIPRKEGDTGLLGYDPRSFLYRTGDREPDPETKLKKISRVIKRAMSS
jgi:histidine triad (HIT) family protein